MFLGFKYMSLFALCFGVLYYYYFRFPFIHNVLVLVYDRHWPSSHICLCFLVFLFSIDEPFTRCMVHQSPQYQFLVLLLCKPVFVVLNIFPSHCTHLPITNQFLFIKLSDLMTLLPNSCLLFEMLKYTHY
jgi:hypothetical protein